MTRGGGKAAQEGKTGAAELAGDEIRGGGGGMPRGEEDGRPQVGEKDQGEPRRLVGTSVGGGGSCWAGETSGEGRRRRPLFSSKPRKKNCGWTFLQLQKRSGTGVKNKFSH